MSSVVAGSDFTAGWLIVFAGQSLRSVALALMTLPVILHQVITNSVRLLLCSSPHLAADRLMCGHVTSSLWSLSETERQTLEQTVTFPL